MSLAAMSSFLVSFRQTATVGLASQTTDCEWSSEIDHAGCTAQTARVTLTPGTPEVMAVGGGGLRALAVKSVSGTIDVVALGISAQVRPGGSVCWSSSTPGTDGDVHISSDDAGAVADVIIIAATAEG